MCWLRHLELLRRLCVSARSPYEASIRVSSAAATHLRAGRCPRSTCRPSSAEQGGRPPEDGQRSPMRRAPNTPRVRVIRRLVRRRTDTITPKEPHHAAIHHRTRDPRRRRPHRRRARGDLEEEASNAAVASLGVPYNWINSYVAGDKIYCVHEAEDAEVILEHARRGRLPGQQGDRRRQRVRPADGRARHLTTGVHAVAGPVSPGGATR